MLGRLWYPQLDIYDTIRRMSLLLLEWRLSPPSPERLFIADFFLANPPLLHKTQMPSTTRKAFRTLRIPREEKGFLKYPLAPILYHKMEPVQREALQSLIGRGLIKLESIKVGKVELSDAGTEFVKAGNNAFPAENEANLINFLVNDYATQDDDGLRNLRQRTGLRRAV